ncbi:MAG: hypothetical protein NVS9B7_07210 [Flavisolibacter sp.]
MKTEQTNGYSCRITIRYKPSELEEVNKLFKSTTCRKLSEYIRKVSLQKPIVKTYRNQSADEFLAEMIRLKNELNAIGNNYNQVVKKLHSLDFGPEIKIWAILNESTKTTF